MNIEARNPRYNWVASDIIVSDVLRKQRSFPKGEDLAIPLVRDLKYGVLVPYY